MLRILALLACLQDDDWTAFRKLAADKDPDQRAQAVERVRKLRDLAMTRALLPLLADEHPRVRLRATQALRAVQGPAEIDHLARTGLRHPHPLIRRGACEALGAIRERSTLPAILDRLADPDPGVRSEAARSSAAFGDPSAGERLADAFRRHHDWPTRTSALEALARIAPSDARELLEPAREDPSYQVRMVAAEAWPGIDRPGAPDALPRLLADRDWRVRAAAIGACLELREPASAGWLVERLARERGRLRWDLITALTDLTGNDLGLEAGPWKAWWDANRETFRPRPARGGARGPEAGTRASFFKVPILSDRIIFILDLSGSMREPSPEGAGLTKLDVAKRGMLETIRSLDADTRFGIIGLGSDADGRYAQREQKTWGRRLALLPASPELKADAERFVRRLEARGWTNLYDAVEYAFADPEVDTIFLYSDGGASRGVFFAGGEVLSEVARLNRFRRIVIHTVEVPGERNPEDNRRLLGRLAADSGGSSRLFEKN